MKYKLALTSVFAICSVALGDIDLGTVKVTSQTSDGDEIDATKIDVRNASMIKDIMRDIPGVYVGGTTPLNQKLYIRGINDRGLNITIDGARQKGNAFHHAADLYLDADIIKSVDVGLGVNSVVGSSGALGGSVAFKTVDASDLLQDGEVFGGKIKGGYASNNDEWQQSLSLYGRAFDNLDILGYIGHRGYNRGKDGNGEVIGGEGDNTNYLMKLGYSFADFAKLSTSAERMQIDGDYGTRAEWPAVGALQNTKYYRDTYTANLNLNPNDLLNLDLNSYYTDHRATTNHGTGLNAGVKTYGGKLINKSKFGDSDSFNQTFVYGSEYYISQSYNNSANPKTPNDKATSLSVFLEDQMRYAGFTLTPGIRFDRYNLDTMGGDFNRTGRAKYSWNEWSPGVLLDYQFDMGLGLYASWAKVFRGPDVIESIRLTQANVLNIVTNNDLKPETGDVYEIGTRFQTPISDNQSISFSAKYFYNDYNNLIIEMGSGGVTEVQRVNGGEAVVKGGEIAARYNVYDLSLGASYSRARTTYKDDLSKVQGYGGVLAYSDAGDKWTFNTEYLISPIDTLIGYNLIGFDSIKAKNGTGTTFTKPGYAVSDIYASWLPDSGKYKGLEINFGIYNIFNKAYWSHSQRSAGSITCRGGVCSPGNIDWEPGRNIKASLSYKF